MKQTGKQKIERKQSKTKKYNDLKIRVDNSCHCAL